MALLENLDQRETLDHLVSSWVWNAGVCRWCPSLGHGSRRAQIPPQEEEEGHSQGGTDYFREDWSSWGGWSGGNIFIRKLPV